MGVHHYIIVMWQIHSNLDSCKSSDFMGEKWIHAIPDSNPTKDSNPSTKMITQLFIYPP